MPVENPDPIESEEPGDDWQELANNAADNWPLEHDGVRALYDNHVAPQLRGRGLGHLVVSKEDKAGARFLHRYGVLEQDEVGNVVGYLRQNGVTIPEKPGDRTAAYLEFMADSDIVNDGIITGDQASIERQIQAHVIKDEDVPESYFALHRRIARERGHGDIKIWPQMRLRMIEGVQAEQARSLEKWVEYLGGEYGNYPSWFKRYTWDSVTRLGLFDKEAGKFSRREADTVAPYPELNREALAYVYDAVVKFHVAGKEIDDARLKQLLKEASFGRLYAHAMLEATSDSPETKNEISGSWTQFRQTYDPRTARRLSDSLQGHGTGWCTAGESTAASQLAAGDFYVYYTRDADGKDTIPRIAIRMQEDVVAEVRGINASQELEPVFIDVVSERLSNLNGGEEYTIKAADMKHVTALDNFLAKDPQAKLSNDDLAFLYELDHTIEGFGDGPDPRIEALLSKRDHAADLTALTGEIELSRIFRALRDRLFKDRDGDYRHFVLMRKLIGPFCIKEGVNVVVRDLHEANMLDLFIDWDALAMDDEVGFEALSQESMKYIEEAVISRLESLMPFYPIPEWQSDLLGLTAEQIIEENTDRKAEYDKEIRNEAAKSLWRWNGNRTTRNI